MKRLGAFLFYAIGALAMLYLALYFYTALTAPKLTPGEPIRIFRKPDAPDYS
jgi:bacteriorhodopsin